MKWTVKLRHWESTTFMTTVLLLQTTVPLLTILLLLLLLILLLLLLQYDCFPNLSLPIWIHHEGTRLLNSCLKFLNRQDVDKLREQAHTCMDGAHLGTEVLYPVGHRWTFLFAKHLALPLENYFIMIRRQREHHPETVQSELEHSQSCYMTKRQRFNTVSEGTILSPRNDFGLLFSQCRRWQSWSGLCERVGIPHSMLYLVHSAVPHVTVQRHAINSWL